MPLWMAVWFICIFLVLFTYYLIRWTIQRRSAAEYEYICPVDRCDFYLNSNNELVLGLVVAGHMENTHDISEG